LIEEESVMKRMFPLVIVLFVLAAVSITFITVDLVRASEMKVEAVELVDMEAAKVTFEATCSKCHTLKRPLGKKKDLAGWESTVERMSSYQKRQKGKAISEEDQKAIIQYLLSVAGK